MSKRTRFVFLASSLVVLAACSGLGCNIPIDVSVEIPIPTDITMPQLPKPAWSLIPETKQLFCVAGDPLTDDDHPVYPDVAPLEIPICSLPTLNDILGMVSNQIQFPIQNMIHLEGAKLIQVKLHPTRNTFENLRYIGVSWLPRGGGDPIDFGNLEQSGGLQGDVVLSALDGSVNLIPILEAGSNPPSDCPKISIQLKGNAPDTTANAGLKFKAIVKAQAWGRAGL
jgi:hypothetical protein